MRAAAALLVAWISCAVLPGAAGAREWQSERLNCAVHVPDSPAWEELKEVSDPRTVLALVDRAGGRSLCLMVIERAEGGALGDQGLATLEEGILKGVGAHKLSGRKCTLGGLPGYELRCALAGSDGKEATALFRVAAAGRRIYSLSATVTGGDPARDPEVSGMLGSFRFLVAPQPPAVKAVAWAEALKWALVLAFSAIVAWLLWRQLRGVRQPPQPPA